MAKQTQAIVKMLRVSKILYELWVNDHGEEHANKKFDAIWFLDKRHFEDKLAIDNQRRVIEFEIAECAKNLIP